MEKDSGEILKNLTARVYRRGEIVFREGEASDGLVYFILSGKAAVLKRVDDKEKVVHSLQPGDIFGEVALLTNRDRIATIMAESEELKVACFDGNSFLREASSNPRFVRKLTIAALTMMERIEERAFSNQRHPHVEGDLLLEYEQLMQPLRAGNLRIQNLLYRSTVKTLQRDSTIFREDQENDSYIYLLITGEVVVEVLRNGRRTVCMKFREGEWLGETALLRKTMRRYSLRIVSQQARVLFLDRDIFFKMMELDPGLFFNVFKTFVLHLCYIEKGTQIPSSG
jgi:CRP-like cAMP-binding protein